MPFFFYKYSKWQPNWATFFVARGERPRTPLKKKKRLNFVSCWVRRNFVNFGKLCLQQIPDYLGLLVNWVNVLYENVISICPSKEHASLRSRRIRAVHQRSDETSEGWSMIHLELVLIPTSQSAGSNVNKWSDQSHLLAINDFYCLLGE